MRGHGCTIVGKVLREAGFTAAYLEVNAQMQLQAKLLNAGPIKFLTAGEVEGREAHPSLSGLSSPAKVPCSHFSSRPPSESSVKTSSPVTAMSGHRPIAHSMPMPVAAQTAAAVVRPCTL